MMTFLANKCRTLGGLFRFFLSGGRVRFLPLLVLLLLLALLLIFTSSLSAIAPFVYTLF